MMALAEVFPFAFFAWLGFAVVTAVLCACLYPVVRNHLARWPPGVRANHLLVWAFAPAAVGVLFASFIFLPSVLSSFGLVANHCQAEGASFSPNCLLHPLAPVEREFPWLLLLPLNALGLFFFAQLVWELLRVHRFARALTRASYPHRFPDIWIIESEWPLALTSGIPQAQVFVSSKLLRSLSSRQLAVVLAHEYAHLCRRDPLWYLLARVVSFLHAPWLRRKLLEDLSLAAEQACDEEAAKQVGDRLLVAETLVQVERLFKNQQASLPALLPSFMGSQVVTRVESLLANPPEPVPFQRILLCASVGLVLIGLALVAEPLHQWTEAVLGFLVG